MAVTQAGINLESKQVDIDVIECMDKISQAEFRIGKDSSAVFFSHSPPISSCHVYEICPPPFPATLFPPGFEFETTQMISHCYSTLRHRATASSGEHKEEEHTTLMLSILRGAFTNYIISKSCETIGQGFTDGGCLHHSRSLYISNMDSRSVGMGTIAHFARNYPSQTKATPEGAEKILTLSLSSRTLVAHIEMNIKRQEAGASEEVCALKFIPTCLSYMITPIVFIVVCKENS
jgi:hypothetical protein